MFIVFLLVCITLVARCASEGRHHRDLEEHLPTRNTPITSPSDRTEGESERRNLPATNLNTPIESPSSILQAEFGLASYYQDLFQGHPTASGELYDPNGLTAAHKSYPFGTRICVTNIENGKNVIVRINDRGPHTPDRIIDLSGQAARILGIVETGIANVQLEILQ